VNYREIDMATFPRRAHFAYFRSLPNPHVGLTAEVDVTALVSFAKEKGISFFLTLLHAVALAANRVPELRQRIRGEGIIEYASCATSHTESTDAGTYCYCTLSHTEPFSDYIRYAAEKQKESRAANSVEEDDGHENYYFVSCLPWISYTSIVQPTGGADDSNPRITWGKYRENASGRLTLPVTLLCHHALVDGAHIAAFYSNLDEEIAKIAEGV